jgi:hypothetical protein
MIPANKKLLALTALIPALAAGPAAQAADAPTPHVKAIVLTTAPEIGKDAVAVSFRTDARVGRKANGRSLDGRVVVLQSGSASIVTLRGGTSCYVAYTDRGHLKLGRRYAVEVDMGKARVTRRLVLRRGGKAAGRGARIGC